MNLKNRFKRFWTLDVHNHEGFTLVELIIVIAILAILSTGAIAGYSAYVEKANMTADKALIAEIENVLTLAGYSEAFVEGESGYLVLSNGDVEGVKDGSNLQVVLADAYGANWKTSLKLKYTDWGYEGSIIGLIDAQAVKNSSYYKSADKLMSQVEDITGAAWNIITGQNGTASRSDMLDMFDDSLLENVVEQYGYSSIDDVPDDALPNLLVLAVATDVADANQTDRELTGASSIIGDFALYNGYASTQAGKDSGFSAAYDEFVAKINEANDVNAVAAAYRDLKGKITNDAGWATYKDTQSESDSAAFAAMMSGMAGAAFTHGEDIKNGLSQSNFFTEGLGNDIFTSYLDSVDAVAGLTGDNIEDILAACDEGKVVIYFTMVNGTVSISNTLPVK